MLVLRPDRLLLEMERLRFARTNPSVENFQLEIAIDERRCMFRLDRWVVYPILPR